MSDISKSDIDRLLLSAVGDKRIVRIWWDAPNYQFGLKSPNDIFHKDGGPQIIFDYVRNAVSGPDFS